MVPVLPYVVSNLGTTVRMLALDRAPAPARAALVPGLARHRGGPAGPRGGIRADAPGPRPLRRRGVAGVPGVVQGAQRALLPAPRLRGGRRGSAARATALPSGPCGASPRRWPRRPEVPAAGIRRAEPVGNRSGRVDALGHGEGVVDDDVEHVDDGPGRRREQAAAALGHADPAAGEALDAERRRSCRAGGRAPRWPGRWRGRSRRRPARR